MIWQWLSSGLILKLFGRPFVFSRKSLLLLMFFFMIANSTRDGISDLVTARFVLNYRGKALKEFIICSDLICQNISTEIWHDVDVDWHRTIDKHENYLRILQINGSNCTYLLTQIPDQLLTRTILFKIRNLLINYMNTRREVLRKLHVTYLTRKLITTSFMEMEWFDTLHLNRRWK